MVLVVSLISLTFLSCHPGAKCVDLRQSSEEWQGFQVMSVHPSWAGLLKRHLPAHLLRAEALNP